MTDLPDLTPYDFIDFGSKKGGSIRFAMNRLGGKRGLGIEQNPDHVKALRAAGYDAVEGDVADVGFPVNSVRFVTMMHILEHMPDQNAMYWALEAAIVAASDFLYITGPYFDGDDYLAEQGLKLYWSDWRGHPNRFTTWDLATALGRFYCVDYVLMTIGPITSSDHPAIHPLMSPVDQHAYDPKVHPSKPHVEFDRPVWREIICCVRLRQFDDWEKVLGAQLGAVRMRRTP